MKTNKVVVCLLLTIVLTISNAFAYDNLSKGSKGEDVAELQRKLPEFGYPVSDSGEFDEETEEAIMDIQKWAGLPVTGVVDEATYEHIFGTKPKDAEEQSTNKASDDNNSIIINNLVAPVDGFTLHSGVQFGMTVNEVVDIEKQKGFDSRETSHTYTFYNENGEYKAKEGPGLSLSGSMIGIDGSELNYFFDDNGRLFAAVYDLGAHDFETYDEIVDLLSEKYGDMRISTSDDAKGYKYPSIFDYYLQDQKIYSNVKDLDLDSFDFTQGSPEIHHCYQEFFVPISETERVYIAHMMCYRPVPGYSKELNLLFGGSHFIEYHYFSTDELDNILESIESKSKRDKEEQDQITKEKERQKNDDI